ncbi:hypothetical protein [Bradyrhizobium sp. RT11b]|uniref:hypothetical protein n=1 Tax=Bradyrhizobium sp. RT11b TaxID=3156332 RepID=UPI00339A96D4
MAEVSLRKEPSASERVGVSPPGVHLQVLPAALLADGRHIVDRLVEVIGDALLVHEDPQALRIGEGIGRGEEFQLVGHRMSRFHLARHLPVRWQVDN